MLLQQASWPEVQEYLQRSQGIIMPIGSTEQHGPNGLVGTDAICPETIARGVAQNLEVLVGPTINFGMAQHHLGFAGTIALRPTTLLALVKDILFSLGQQGFRYIFFLNGHGGNMNSVKAAFSEYYAEQSFGVRDAKYPLYTTIENWWKLPQVAKLADELYGAAEGSHATPSEVSLTYYAYPESVKHVKIEPEIAPNSEFFDAKDYRERFPDGRMGSNPGMSCVEHGGKFYHAAVEDVTRLYREFLATYP